MSVVVVVEASGRLASYFPSIYENLLSKILKRIAEAYPNSSFGLVEFRDSSVFTERNLVVRKAIITRSFDQLEKTCSSIKFTDGSFCCGLVEGLVAALEIFDKIETTDNFCIIVSIGDFDEKKQCRVAVNPKYEKITVMDAMQLLKSRNVAFSLICPLVCHQKLENLIEKFNLKETATCESNECKVLVSGIPGFVSASALTGAANNTATVGSGLDTTPSTNNSTSTYGTGSTRSNAPTSTSTATTNLISAVPNTNAVAGAVGAASKQLAFIKNQQLTLQQHAAKNQQEITGPSQAEMNKPRIWTGQIQWMINGNQCSFPAEAHFVETVKKIAQSPERHLANTWPQSLTISKIPTLALQDIKPIISKFSIPGVLMNTSTPNQHYQNLVNILKNQNRAALIVLNGNPNLEFTNQQGILLIPMPATNNVKLVGLLFIQTPLNVLNPLLSLSKTPVLTQKSPALNPLQIQAQLPPIAQRANQFANAQAQLTQLGIMPSQVSAAQLAQAQVQIAQAQLAARQIKQAEIAQQAQFNQQQLQMASLLQMQQLQNNPQFQQQQQLMAAAQHMAMMNILQNNPQAIPALQQQQHQNQMTPQQLQQLLQLQRLQPKQ